MGFVDVETGADGRGRGGLVGLGGRVCSSLGWRVVRMTRLGGLLMLLLLRLAGVVGGDDAEKVVNVIYFQHQGSEPVEIHRQNWSFEMGL